jgi:parallel beta-helix repeat protein
MRTERRRTMREADERKKKVPPPFTLYPSPFTLYALRFTLPKIPRSRITAFLGVGLAAALGLLSFAAFGADGRIPIPGGTSEYVIRQPGSYYLTGDITTGDGAALAITANDVTLDLNGHTLTNTVTSGNYYVLVGSSGVTRVHVTNGSIKGGAYGVYFAGAGGDYQIDNLSISGCGSDCLHVEGTSGSPGCAVILHNSIYAKIGAANSNYGIYARYLNGARIEDNSVYGGTQACLYLESGAGCSVSRNAFSFGVNLGLVLKNSSNSSVTNNTVTHNGSVGIYLWGSGATSDANTISYNNASGNKWGISLESATRNAVDWNECAGNSSYGIIMDAASIKNEYAYNRTQTSGGSISSGNFDGGGNF